MPVCCKLAQVGTMQGRAEKRQKEQEWGKWGSNLKYGKAVSQSLQMCQTIGLVGDLQQFSD